jgi:hypothetical protein
MIFVFIVPIIFIVSIIVTKVCPEQPDQTTTEVQNETK